MACTPALAQQESAGDGAPVSLEAALRSEVWPSSVMAPQSLRFSPGDSAGSVVVDSRLWLGAGRASLGVGVAASPRQALAAGPWFAGSGASSMLLGVRFRLSDRSRLYVDSASWADQGLPGERDLRMGFEFKPAPSTALGLARGTLMRVQWNSHSQLSLRVRSGGLAVALKSQF